MNGRSSCSILAINVACAAVRLACSFSPMLPGAWPPSVVNLSPKPGSESGHTRFLRDN